jgi:multidrug efflux pump subunit AcrA (membrane-fusion protein)
MNDEMRSLSEALAARERELATAGRLIVKATDRAYAAQSALAAAERRAEEAERKVERAADMMIVEADEHATKLAVLTAERDALRGAVEAMHILGYLHGPVSHAPDPIMTVQFHRDTVDRWNAAYDRIAKARAAAPCDGKGEG